MKIFKIIINIFFLFCGLIKSSAQIVVKVNEPKAIIQPTMWGIFFEDINMAADGGLYAELVKNRSFEFTQPLMGWKEQNKQNGSVLIVNRNNENTANPRFARVSVKTNEPYGLTNEGFRGMGIKKNNGYDFSVWAKLNEGEKSVIHAQLITSKNEIAGEAKIIVEGNSWKKYAVSFNSSVTDEKAKLNVWFEGKSVVDVDMISLFPKDTWKNRSGGLRADLVQKLADLKPGFIRFPGGCIVEGRDLANRYQWKKTVGNIEDRQLIINRWNTEFSYRSTPDYFQSFGLGFFEYFQLAEDIGAEPLPIINCGMACQFNSAEVVATNELDGYIQDALDLIEFANGSTETKWGKLRATMGHPQPFNLKMLGVGNENWGPQYIERLTLFTKAIKAKYPAIKLVNSSGTDPIGERFDYLNGELRKINADLIDEHYYRPPEWFLANAKRYDNYPRNGSKVFAGEYAAHSNLTNDADKKNNWQSALAEAAFMTGLERNADVVSMASYAPLFAHIDAWQWAPDLIWFNNLQSYASPNYYVQQMYSLNKGTTEVSVTNNGDVVAGQDSLYAAASIDSSTNELIIKIVNTSVKQQIISLSLEGVKKITGRAKIIELKSDNLNSVNSFSQPEKIAPKESEIFIHEPKFNLPINAYSFIVLKIKM
ncbi:extracellular exo-alpha-L-arabinofuranosidase precursor [mine drainage metagenome]|uniref:non-reducing end alpha-L-arabinofuranosidase n=1 Tax=mine drainage metagenome TaxID=410659 RepID=A0A1J5T0A8_9ZZZZ